jgi:hypothetical protein
MSSRAKLLVPFLCLIFVLVSLATGARAQSWQLLNASIALKSGETAEAAYLYYVINCRSQLKSLPEVTILDGPPGVTAVVSEAKITPRFHQCARPISAGKLNITAGEIEDPSNTTMTLRIKYKTKDRAYDRSMSFNIALFP